MPMHIVDYGFRGCRCSECVQFRWKRGTHHASILRVELIQYHVLLLQLDGISLHLDLELRLLVVDVLYLGLALGDFFSASLDQLLKMVFLLPLFVLLALYLLQFDLLCIVCFLVSLLLFPDHLEHGDLLILKVLYLCLGPVEVHAYFAGLLVIVIDLRCMVLERGA